MVHSSDVQHAPIAEVVLDLDRLAIVMPWLIGRFQPQLSRSCRMGKLRS